MVLGESKYKDVFVKLIMHTTLAACWLPVHCSQILVWLQPYQQGSQWQIAERGVVEYSDTVKSQNLNSRWPERMFKLDEVQIRE